MRISLEMESNTKYLLIIGDETIVPPISTTEDNCSIVEITDDKFNEEFTTGRLIVKTNEEALNQIQKIKNYVLNPIDGEWKNELLLISGPSFKLSRLKQ